MKLYTPLFATVIKLSKRMSTGGKYTKLLFFSLPITIFEHLAEDRNESNRSRSSFTSNSNGNALFGSSHHNHCLLWSKDPRIKLGIYLHPHITRFNVDGKGNELMLMQQNENEGMAGGMGGGLDEFFWCAHLRRLVNLTHLNLNLITTDEILLLGIIEIILLLSSDGDKYLI